MLGSCVEDSTDFNHFILRLDTTSISDILQGCIPGSVRLINSSAPAATNRIQGIVELCSDGNWSRICNESWDYRDAVVTCNQLGLPSYGNS